MSYRLMRRVDQRLREIPGEVPTGLPLIEHVRPTVQLLCSDLAAAFHCREVSIFLENRLEAPGTYELVGSTARAYLPRTSLRAQRGDGILGWNLMQPRARVRFADLCTTSEEELRNRYRRMKEDDIAYIVARVAEDREVVPKTPISLMTAPMMHAGRPIGIIQCSVGRGPFYFGESEHELLESIASLISRSWSELIDRREIADENASLQKLVEQIRHLNSYVHGEIMKREPDQKGILREALRITSTVIPGAEIMDVRLLNEERTALTYAATEGDAWKRGTPQEIKTRRELVFPIDGAKPDSAGAYVINTGQTYPIRNTAKDHFYRAIFPETKRMIIAPLALQASQGAAAEIYGVLDVRSVLDRDFPPYANAIATLLGSQLALYHKLGIIALDQKTALRKVEKSSEENLQINEDMQHQSKMPINMAVGRVQDLLRALAQHPTNAEIEQQLLAIRGACNRAKHVNDNTELFVQLARDRPIVVKKEGMTGGDLARMLILTAVDLADVHQESSVGLYRRPAKLWASRTPVDGRPQFFVAPDFDKIEFFMTDRKLLEQAITQVLDNAFKYSYRDEKVQVRGGNVRRTKDLEIQIGVVSEGLKLSKYEAQRATQRGFQGSDAPLFSATGGRGIGLWLVHHIMTALGGELEVRPTDENGATEVVLFLPA